MDESRRSDAGHVIDVLVDSGVLVPTTDEELQLGDAFLDRLETQEAFVHDRDEDEWKTLLSRHCDDAEAVDALVAVSGECPELVAEYLALTEETQLPHADRLRVLPSFDSIRPDGPPDDGVPDAFLAVGGSRLPFVVNMFDRSIVYVWKHDCGPCDLVRADFDDVFETSPDDLGLFAVHGPSAARFLYDQYRVDGAPTTLFFLDGDVDARLRAAHSPDVLANEIEKLRTLPGRATE